jgi:hypothetical protein
MITMNEIIHPGNKYHVKYEGVWYLCELDEIYYFHPIASIASHMEELPEPFASGEADIIDSKERN